MRLGERGLPNPIADIQRRITVVAEDKAHKSDDSDVGVVLYARL